MRKQKGNKIPAKFKFNYHTQILTFDAEYLFTETNVTRTFMLPYNQPAPFEKFNNTPAINCSVDLKKSTTLKFNFGKRKCEEEVPSTKLDLVFDEVWEKEMEDLLKLDSQFN